MRATSTVLLALLSVVGVASAQTTQTLPRGTRVRVTPATPTQVVVGRLIAVTDSSLVVRRDRGDLAIPHSVIQRLEVSQGTRRGKSALRGALLGSVIGGVVGYYSVTENSYYVDQQGGAAIGAIYGAVCGSLIGLLVGSFERWRDTAVPMSLSVMPTGGQSLSVAGRIAF